MGSGPKTATGGNRCLFRSSQALVIAMKSKNITSLKIGWATIGQSQTQAEEVISLANVQLQATVLSEWFRSLDAGTLFPERSVPALRVEPWAGPAKQQRTPNDWTCPWQDLTQNDLPQFAVSSASPRQ